ncbi:MAG: transcriptional repressor [Gemmatimonadota bacterium]
MTKETAQRRAIRRAFERSGRPLAPAEVLHSAREECPSLGLATVYRNLRLLVEEEWLALVALPGTSPRYERAGKPHHHHFLCRSCDQAFDIAACTDAFHSLVPSGFRIEDHDITLFGLCSRCARAA